MTVERWTDERLDRLAESIEHLTQDVQGNTEAIKKLTDESKEQNIKFTAYQQSTQWVVQLAFSLIASATITVIITTIFRR